MRKNKNHTTSFINTLDIFGRPVQFTFKGSQHFKSFLGGVASIICYIVIGFVFILQSQELLFGHDQAFHFTSDGVNDIDEVIDLYELNYFFAIEKLEKEVARIEVTQVSREEGRSTLIPMVDCADLIDEGWYSNVDFDGLLKHY